MKRSLQEYSHIEHSVDIILKEFDLIGDIFADLQENAKSLLRQSQQQKQSQRNVSQSTLDLNSLFTFMESDGFYTDILEMEQEKVQTNKRRQVEEKIVKIDKISTKIGNTSSEKVFDDYSNSPLSPPELEQNLPTLIINMTSNRLENISIC